MTDAEAKPSGLRRLLDTKFGALLQIALVAAWAFVLPDNVILLPIFMAASAGALLWLLGDTSRSVGLAWPRGRVWRLALGAVIVGAVWQLVVFGLLLPMITSWLEIEPARPEAVPASTEAVVAALVIFGFAHPLAEGLSYRSFLLSRLERLFARSAVSVALSASAGALLAGLASWNQGPAGVLAALATGGVLNLLYYWEQRNVLPTVLAHSVYNVLAIGLSL